MDCPVDSKGLVGVKYEGSIAVDRCSECGGMWLDHKELESIQDIRDNDYSKELSTIPNYFDKSYEMALAKAEGNLDCPNCHHDMEKREYGYCSQIMIDVCPTCRGVWLHKDELSELEIFFERCHAETAKARAGFFGSLNSFFD